MFKLVLEKAEGPEIKFPSSIVSSKKQESSRQNIYFCFIDYAKAFDCVDHNKLWKILNEMDIPDHLTCLLRNLNAEFQRIARREKKAFLSDQCKEIEENKRMGKTRDLFKKMRDTREYFMQS